jgi:rhodanese-related sulfurtransferase
MKMLQFRTLPTVFLWLLLLPSCRLASGQAFDQMVHQLLSHTVPEVRARDIYPSTHPQELVWLDAREREEFEVSHIANALWAGYDDFSLDRLNGISKHTPIVVYCSVGYRSEKIAEKLIAAGYTHVANLVGGMFDWVNCGYPVVDTAGSPTAKVHAFSPAWGIWLEKGEKVY